MTAFWIAAALLALFALGFLLIRRGRRSAIERSALNVSVYRDQLRELEADRAAGTLSAEDYERSRREIEARVLQDVPEAQASRVAHAGRKPVVFAAIAIPVVAGAVYFAVGNPAAVVPPSQQVEDMVSRLAEKLKNNPEDTEGWKLLGRSYAVLGRFPEAVDAYARAAAKAPRDAQLLADFADALAMARGRSLAGEPEQLVQRALEIDPANGKALALAGSAAFDRKEYAKAADYWQRMLPLVEPDSEDARMIQGNISEARNLAGIPEKKSSTKPAVAKGGLRGTVRLAPELLAKASPDDSVFIFARAASGPPMPLAVVRKQVRELPAQFALDDSMAMAGGMTLSSQQSVVVGARVSKSGSATPQPGDFEGYSKPVSSNASAVSVTIDKVR